MRHRVDHRKLNRTSSHRRAMLRNMVISLFEKERITTTDAKAKEARRFAERLITRAKKGYGAFKESQSLRDAGKEAEATEMQAVALSHWRQAARFVQNRAVLRKLFNELAPLYDDREGGYTRILRLGTRMGDSAQKVMLELVGTEITSQPKIKKARKKVVEEEVPVEPADLESAEEAELIEETEPDTAGDSASSGEAPDTGEKSEVESKDSGAGEKASKAEAPAKAGTKDSVAESKKKPPKSGGKDSGGSRGKKEKKE